MSTPSKSQSSTAAGGRRNSPTAHPSPARTTSATGKDAILNPPTNNSASRSRTSRTPGAGTPPVSARAAVKKPANGSLSATNAANGSDVDGPDPDSKLQTMSAIDDLQESLRQSQKTCEDYRKQIAILQARAEDSTNDHRKLEETVQELTGRSEQLENEKRDGLKSKRELESTYEAESQASLKFRSEALAKEEELTDTIRRLKESLAQRDSRTGTEEGRKPELLRATSSRSGHSPQTENSQFAPPSSLQRSDSRSSSRLVLQKDKIIESLRIELAEAQIKLVEMENIGGGQVQQLERNLMDSRIANAKLMEENESFQLLLSEKTMSGEFIHHAIFQTVDMEATPVAAGKGSSLEDELELAEQADNDETKDYKIQIAKLKEDNKALTLYINSIISRLLQHDFDFILDKDAEVPSGKVAARLEKELPPSPPNKDEEGTGFLARTKSLMGNRKPRPQSAVYSSEFTARSTPHENPDTAPSIPIGRPQNRSTSGSDKRRSVVDWNSAAVVNNMYRGPSPTRSAGPVSPGITSPRNSFFQTRPANPSRGTSGSYVATINEDEAGEHKSNRDSKISSSRNSLASESSSLGSAEKPSNSVMVGSKMRPLRLVQENSEENNMSRPGNRASWMGWFNKGT